MSYRILKIGFIMMCIPFLYISSIHMEKEDNNSYLRSTYLKKMLINQEQIMKKLNITSP
jgi:hypothetical protein